MRIKIGQPIFNVLTIDAEDWYASSLALLNGPSSVYAQRPTRSVISNTRRVLEILEQYGYKATFFVLAPVAEHYPELVREIYDAGHEIATHGYAHRLVYEMRPKEFEEDLIKSLKLIENVIGEKVIGHRAGYFSITKQSLWALDILAERGIKYDSSIFPIRRRLYGIPDFPRFVSQVRGKGRYGLREVPPSTVRIWGQNFPIAGGGYLRVLPYWVIKRGIRKVNAEGHPAVIYLHPYELDPQDIKVPGASLGWGTRFTQLSQQFNRSTFERKLRRLLRDFKFGSVREVLDL